MQSIVLLLSILGCIYIVHGLECYYCESDVNSGCGDPFNASAMNDDNTDDDTTFIACVKVKSESNGIFSISRRGVNTTGDCSGDVNGFSFNVSLPIFNIFHWVNLNPNKCTTSPNGTYVALNYNGNCTLSPDTLTTSSYKFVIEPETQTAKSFIVYNDRVCRLAMNY
ncbi:unnamed protein product [Rotaria socialis]|uniref:Uncharacterized protein n=1 Tax=Rotaria socialis TaxID=392032 RepID=A0A820WXR4_9BILA|nr:unnamed protein product [Rotaria socialis]